MLYYDKNALIKEIERYHYQGNIKYQSKLTAIHQRRIYEYLRSDGSGEKNEKQIRLLDYMRTTMEF